MVFSSLSRIIIIIMHYDSDVSCLDNAMGGPGPLTSSLGRPRLDVLRRSE